MAEPPSPFEPCVPFPAIAVIVPFEILRLRELTVSTTYKFPKESIARLDDPLKNGVGCRSAVAPKAK
jgi:hypothetical protein